MYKIKIVKSTSIKKNIALTLIILFSQILLLSRLSYSSPKDNDYQIGIGDKIFISVLKNENLSTTVTVRSDGKISFFMIDDVMVLGLTPLELKNMLTRKLEQSISNPDVTVIIAQINSIEVYVFGEVIKPGSYNLKKRISLLHFLSLAGGVKKTANIDSAFLLREQKKIDIDFYKLLYEGDLTQNIILKGDDLLFFPDNSDKRITVFGEINIPGSIPYRRGLNIMDVIVQSGGMNKYANQSKIKIIRDNKIIIFDLKTMLEKGNLSTNIDMLPDDVVIVPKSLF